MSESIEGEELQILEGEKKNLSDTKYGSGADGYSDEEKQEVKAKRVEMASNFFMLQNIAHICIDILVNML